MELPNGIERISPETIQGLDVVFLGTGLERETPLKGVVLEDGRKIEGKSLDDLFIFATTLDKCNLTGDLPSPIFNYGSPYPQKIRVNNYDTFNGLMPSRIAGDYLYLKQCWESRVDVSDSGEAAVYAGQGNWFPTMVLRQPIPFDVSKRLLFVRSPNGLYNPESIGTSEWEEYIGILNNPKLVYHLVYIDLARLKAQYKWAMNWGELGIVKDKNLHLAEE